MSAMQSRVWGGLAFFWVLKFVKSLFCFCPLPRGRGREAVVHTTHQPGRLIAQFSHKFLRIFLPVVPRSALSTVFHGITRQVPPQHIQQRSDLPGYPAEPVEPDLRHLRHPDVDPVPLVRPQPGIPCKFGGESQTEHVCVAVIFYRRRRCCLRFCPIVFPAHLLGCLVLFRSSWRGFHPPPPSLAPSGPVLFLRPVCSSALLVPPPCLSLRPCSCSCSVLRRTGVTAVPGEPPGVQPPRAGSSGAELGGRVTCARDTWRKRLQQ